ncbi:MAG TPA: hypothetical protein VJV75_06740 [Candidatus Polarisedimenticolia bacterium]|nr:hypothetical protein [Candidatus Polarisedimenticolia bacterium]
MTTGCATSGTETTPARHTSTPKSIGAALLLFAAFVTADALQESAFPAAAAPAPVPPAAPTGDLLNAADLRDRMEKTLKVLRKAQDATDGTDAGKVSFFLQRADELMIEFQAGSGLDTITGAFAAARAAASKGEFTAARADLFRGRKSLRSLSDYTVARPAEVAYRAADAALDGGNAQAFDAAVGRLEATVLPGYLKARVGDARAAIARGRSAMVRRDMKAGRKEVDSARLALGRLDYASALSQSRYALMIGGELLGEGAFLAAKDQVQDALRQVARAIRKAPEADVEALNAVDTDVKEIWRRVSKPQPDDAGRLAEAADQIETLRQKLR